MTCPSGIPVCFAISLHSISRILSVLTCSLFGSYPCPSDTHSSGTFEPRSLPGSNSDLLSLMMPTAFPCSVGAGMTAIDSWAVCILTGKKLFPTYRTGLPSRRRPMLGFRMLCPPEVPAFDRTKLLRSADCVPLNCCAALRAEPFRYARQELLHCTVKVGHVNRRLNFCIAHLPSPHS